VAEKATHMISLMILFIRYVADVWYKGNDIFLFLSKEYPYWFYGYPYYPNIIDRHGKKI